MTSTGVNTSCNTFQTATTHDLHNNSVQSNGKADHGGKCKPKCTIQAVFKSYLKASHPKPVHEATGQVGTNADGPLSSQKVCVRPIRSSTSSLLLSICSKTEHRGYQAGVTKRDDGGRRFSEPVSGSGSRRRVGWVMTLKSSFVIKRDFQKLWTDPNDFETPWGVKIEPMITPERDYSINKFLSFMHRMFRRAPKCNDFSEVSYEYEKSNLSKNSIIIEQAHDDYIEFSTGQHEHFPFLKKHSNWIPHFKITNFPSHLI